MKINKIISLIMISLMLFSAVEYSALAASVNYIDLAKGNILCVHGFSDTGHQVSWR